MRDGKYLVLAFYPNLGIKIRATAYDTEEEMYEYIGGLRLCETPYLAGNQETDEVIDKEVYSLGAAQMLRMLCDEYKI